VSKGWQRKKLGEVCTIDKAQGIHRGLPYIGLEHIESNTARFIGIPDPQSVKSTTFRFTQEHVLYGRLRPYLNKAHLPSFVGHCSTEIYPLKPGRELTREYLLRWLLSESTCMLINKTCRGARMPRAKMGELMKFEIPVPPLQEQRRIIKLLEEAFAGIDKAKENAEQNLRNARALLESHLKSVFTNHGPGWVETRLGELCVVDWGNTALTKRAYVKDGEYLAVSAAGCDGRIGHKEHAKHTPVLSAIGAQCGRMFLPDEEFTAIKNTITLTPRHGKCTGKFLYRLLTHVQLPKRGAAQPFISKGDIQAFKVSVPGLLSDQHELEKAVSDIEERTRDLERNYEKRIGCLDGLKKSILHEAFSGNL